MDYAIYAVHAVFWAAFGITRLVTGRRGAARSGAPEANQEKRAAPFSRTLLAIHMSAFGIMYFGLANAVLGHRVPDLFPYQRVVGAGVIALGSALMCWAAACFNSWRFRAELDVGHELTTSGPFAFMRHPIYAGLNLLAIGTAIWAPTLITGVAVAMMVLGSDLRARAEEKLLIEGFGDQYRAYMARTRRFLPGVY